MLEEKAKVTVNDLVRYKQVREGETIMDMLALEQLRTPEEYFRNIRIDYKGRTVESEEKFKNPREGEKIRVSNNIKYLN